MMGAPNRMVPPRQTGDTIPGGLPEDPAVTDSRPGSTMDGILGARGWKIARQRLIQAVIEGHQARTGIDS